MKKTAFEKLKERWEEEIIKIELIEEGCDKASCNHILDMFSDYMVSVLENMNPDEINEDTEHEIHLLNSKIVTTLDRSNARYNKLNQNPLMKLLEYIVDILKSIKGIISG